MKKKNLVTRKLFKKLNKSINKYVKIFEKKHNLEFDYWVADLTGTIGVFGDYFFNFEDIRLDLELKIPKHMIFDWYDDALESHTLTGESLTFYQYIKDYR